MKRDMKKELKELYNPSKKEVSFINVPPMDFIMVDGRGDPNGSALFEEAVGLLYGIAYAIKFARKKADGLDFVVMPLEGLWWMADMKRFRMEAKDEWLWTLMIMQPDGVTVEDVEAAKTALKKKDPSVSVDKLRFERYDEGMSAQIMYIGPFSEEGPTIIRIHETAEAQGYRLDGKHHEIYMSDPRRTAPEKLKTVIRQPISKAVAK